MNILLIGGSGFIGKAILNKLLDEGHTVMATQHKTPIGTAQHPKLTVIKTAIGKIRLSKLPYIPDVVIHAARNNASFGGKWGRMMVAAKGFVENNRLMNEVRSSKTPVRMIYISGSLMYGNAPQQFIDETFPTRPVSFAREYVQAEKPILKEIEKSNPNVVMLRVPWVIGDGSWFKWNYANYMARHKAVPLYGNGQNRMTFVDVADIANAVEKLLGFQLSGLLNIYNPERMTQQDWATKLSIVSGLPVHQLSNTEMAALGKAVNEAFNTDIWLSSIHSELLASLQKDMMPVSRIVERYLPSMLQNI
ncbi:MAG: NAD(P)-dependent oxidoreductase [Sphingobacteriales bacterium]|nr:MAG: NAD(P)-dependent oxidoreductase [Sphingobacteriales bacterium]